MYFIYMPEYKAQDENGNIIARLFARKNKRGEGTYIGGLHVDENHRRMGIGGRLVDQAIAAENHPISLEVDANNKIALGMYLLRGFREISRVESGGKTYIRMQKD